MASDKQNAANAAAERVFVALGANLPHPVHGAPRATLEAVLLCFPEFGLVVVGRSPWYATAPVPASDQPDFVNGVVEVATALGPDAALAALHALEARFGRARSVRWEARVIDLDLLAYGARIVAGRTADDLTLPHPRLHERAFVLWPLADIAPAWRHPVLGLTAAALREGLRAAPPPRRLPD